MPHAVDTPKPDLAAVKQRQQAAWSSGDFSVVATRIVLTAEQLCDTADLRAGWRVLDVATGSGNAALAAARHGASAVGVDYVPALLEDGRKRAAAEGLAVELSRATPRTCRSPTPRSTRSRRSSGRCSRPTTSRPRTSCCASAAPAARSAWQLDAGGLHRRPVPHDGRHVPPPAGVRSPMLWGTEAHLRELFGDDIASLEVTGADVHVPVPVGRALRRLLPPCYGPTLKAFAALEGAARDALERDLIALIERFDRLGTGDAVAIPATYIEAVAIKR